MHSAVPALRQYLREIAFSNRRSNIFTRNGNNQDVFAAPTQHFLSDGAGKAVPRNQEPQCASTISILKLLTKDDKFVFPALAAPVLALGQNKR